MGLVSRDGAAPTKCGGARPASSAFGLRATGAHPAPASRSRGRGRNCTRGGAMRSGESQRVPRHRRNAPPPYGLMSVWSELAQALRSGVFAGERTHVGWRRCSRYSGSRRRPSTRSETTRVPVQRSISLYTFRGTKFPLASIERRGRASRSPVGVRAPFATPDDSCAIRVPQTRATRRLRGRKNAW